MTGETLNGQERTIGIIAEELGHYCLVTTPLVAGHDITEVPTDVLKKAGIGTDRDTVFVADAAPRQRTEHLTLSAFSPLVRY